MPHSFQLSPTECQRALRRQIIASIVILALILAIFWWIVQGENHLPGAEKVAVLAVVLGLVGFGLIRGYRRAKQQLLSFMLTVSDDRITRHMTGLADFVIVRESITAIHECRRGILTIHGSPPTQILGVPFSLENRDQLHALLSDWKPITKSKPKHFRFAVSVSASTLFIVTGIATFAMGPSRWVVACAVTFIVISAVFLWIIQRSPHLDSRAKRGAWLILAPAVCALFRLILSLSPEQW